ncbi:ABC transporter ATP-binding protein [Actinokineospora globicatena]|uniref:ABC transporter ATP-binding protein n=1 Tax=Actinokineospora globicatena TaxID=103729 RepID=UPI0020A4D6AC|nr:ATP-binding cassette domain-containing protein [Actinokineospora globicatena]MCP2303932.1 energy-coupling factor transport system ATP-binding protein [Actinokineospora globicatena]GLW78907.1 cobalt ABC transporter ATP-binding protein [Actinokineospora globicatena]GLW86680.1 cobalt ABC transporter ATP-binding protein [Actinokineospora globicatena]
MIELDRVSFWYHGQADPVLSEVTLSVGEGEFVLMAGRTGSGKSTLLGTINGLVPHFTGGHLDGTVSVDGVATHAHPPRELAHLVGVVGQDPLAGFVTDTVEEELAYGMEQLGVAPQVMRRRVEETLDLLGIADLRRRALRTLSGGQQQRVAIGSVLTMHPKVLVLDEPTSALDPTAAEDVLATLARLVLDLGTTVVVAEHRMERVVPFADRMIYVPGDGSVVDGEPADVLRSTPVAPPIVELGRLLRWDPLPLSVRDARRRARDLDLPAPPVRHEPNSGVVLLSASDVVVRYGATVAVRGVDLTLRAGEVLAVMGRNGSGKSSLLWALQGSGPRQGGSVTVGEKDPKTLSSAEARKVVGLVPQTASDLLYLQTVDAECEAADRESGASAGTCRALLDRLAPDVAADRHPRDLSEGQRLALVLAVQLSAAPAVVLLDEPTRGLDYPAKSALTRMIADIASDGRTVVVATHDVEFVATTAARTVVMAEGEIVSDGPTTEVLGGSPAFATQIAKILGPDWLTLADVAAALPQAAR